eukprot:scaffold1954_cov268-Pinguiococcus_pyrenoidosus.AAC.154
MCPLHFILLSSHNEYKEFRGRRDLFGPLIGDALPCPRLVLLRTFRDAMRSVQGLLSLSQAFPRFRNAGLSQTVVRELSFSSLAICALCTLEAKVNWVLLGQFETLFVYAEALSLGKRRKAEGFPADLVHLRRAGSQQISLFGDACAIAVCRLVCLPALPGGYKVGVGRAPSGALPLEVPAVASLKGIQHCFVQRVQIIRHTQCLFAADLVRHLPDVVRVGEGQGDDPGGRGGEVAKHDAQLEIEAAQIRRTSTGGHLAAHTLLDDCASCGSFRGVSTLLGGGPIRLPLPLREGQGQHDAIELSKSRKLAGVARCLGEHVVIILPVLGARILAVRQAPQLPGQYPGRWNRLQKVVVKIEQRETHTVA